MHQKATILLVEDDPIDVMSIQRAFQKNNITNRLVTVNDGEQALDFLYKRGDFHNEQALPKPDLILLDINMPRMNGLEFLQAIKNDPQFVHIPVVILTSSEYQSDIKRGFVLQAAGYIVKPVAFDIFCKAIMTIDSYWTLSMLP